MRPLASNTVSKKDNEDQLPLPTKVDKERLVAIWKAFAVSPQTTNISPQNLMDAWVVEHRMKADRRATARLTRATWVLALITLALVIATCVLVYVTAVHREGSGWPDDPVTFSGAR